MFVQTLSTEHPDRKGYSLKATLRMVDLCVCIHVYMYISLYINVYFSWGKELNVDQRRRILVFKWKGTQCFEVMKIDVYTLTYTHRLHSIH